MTKKMCQYFCMTNCFKSPNGHGSYKCPKNSNDDCEIITPKVQRSIVAFDELRKVHKKAEKVRKIKL